MKQAVAVLFGRTMSLPWQSHACNLRIVRGGRLVNHSPITPISSSYEAQLRATR